MHLILFWIVCHLSAKNYQSWWKFEEVMTKISLHSFLKDIFGIFSCLCILQMLSIRRARRLVGYIAIVSGLTMLFFWSTSTDGSLNVTQSSLVWSALGNLSVFVPQPDGPRNNNSRPGDEWPPLVRGPQGVAVPIRTRCGPGRSNKDDIDRVICRPLLAGNTSSTARPGWTDISLTEYLRRADNCDCFRSVFGYFASPEDTTEEERQFPIAFSLLAYENLEQTERLLRMIYRPHNVYCIHVDAKAWEEMHQGMIAISNCFDNVFLAKPPVKISWGKISIVHAEILCMRQLLDTHKRWKYFINLVGRDLPLRTNYELVRILQAYDGANDVQASRYEEQ